MDWFLIVMLCGVIAVVGSMVVTSVAKSRIARFTKQWKDSPKPTPNPIREQIRAELASEEMRELIRAEIRTELTKEKLRAEIRAELEAELAELAKAQAVGTKNHTTVF